VVLICLLRSCGEIARVPVWTDTKPFMPPAATPSHMFNKTMSKIYGLSVVWYDHLCGIVVRVLGYRSGDLGSIPGTTKKK
jgi:hypothetical protein